MIMIHIIESKFCFVPSKYYHCHVILATCFTYVSRFLDMFIKFSSMISFLVSSHAFGHMPKPYFLSASLKKFS